MGMKQIEILVYSFIQEIVTKLILGNKDCSRTYFRICLPELFYESHIIYWKWLVQLTMLYVFSNWQLLLLFYFICLFSFQEIFCLSIFKFISECMYLLLFFLQFSILSFHLSFWQLSFLWNGEQKSHSYNFICNCIQTSWNWEAKHCRRMNIHTFSPAAFSSLQRIFKQCLIFLCCIMSWWMVFTGHSL